MKLIFSTKTFRAGDEVKIGDRIPDFRGDYWYLKSADKPARPGTTGYVYVSKKKEDKSSANWARFYPSVFDLEWIED